LLKPRVVETTEGIQEEFDVKVYDKMTRNLRDHGWLETNLILKNCIARDLSLEIGPGPGYLRLGWLKNMIRLAEKNAEEYGLQSPRREDRNLWSIYLSAR
jgi:hypothetical protein